MLAAQQVGGGEYEKAVLDFGRLYPGDASQALWAIDLHLAREQWDRALKSVDVLESAVGGDVFLDDMRGNVLLLAGRPRP